MHCYSIRCYRYNWARKSPRLMNLVGSMDWDWCQRKMAKPPAVIAVPQKRIRDMFSGDLRKTGRLETDGCLPGCDRLIGRWTDRSICSLENRIFVFWKFQRDESHHLIFQSSFNFSNVSGGRCSIRYNALRIIFSQVSRSISDGKEDKYWCNEDISQSLSNTWSAW